MYLLRRSPTDAPFWYGAFQALLQLAQFLNQCRLHLDANEGADVFTRIGHMQVSSGPFEARNAGFAILRRTISGVASIGAPARWRATLYDVLISRGSGVL